MVNEEQGGHPSLAPVVATGRNCWRIERAERAAAVIDAANYYHFVREAMIAARRRILIIGWDFDTRITLEPDENGREGRPDRPLRRAGGRTVLCHHTSTLEEARILVKRKQGQSCYHRLDCEALDGCLVSLHSQTTNA